MLFNENYKRSLTAFTTDILRGFRKVFMVVFAILAALPVVNAIAIASLKKWQPQAIILSSNGMLGIGFFTMLITLSISFFVSTSNSEILTQFVWPINRKVYAVGNFLVMSACALISVSGVSALLPVEVLSARILKAAFDDLILVNNITFENFLVGFWISFCYIMLFSSFSYCLGMYFFRYKIITTVLLILLANLSAVPAIGSFYNAIYAFIFEEGTSIMLFSVKVWFAILLLHILPYIQLRRMEVRL